MRIGDRVKFKTIGGWYNSGIIRDMNEDSYLIEVDELGCKPPKDVYISLPYYAKVLSCEMIAEKENRAMQIHELKISPKYFDDVKSDKKRFEIRKDDRDYKVGDLIILKEYENGHYTGREIKNIPIIYILRDANEYGLMDGYCILGL